MKPINQYKTIVFDCDGVVLNSNKVKVNAYYQVAIQHGGTPAQAQAFVDHHIAKGSYPRNGKIVHYLENIIHQAATPEKIAKYIQTFEEILDKTLMECEIAAGLLALKAKTPNARWMLLSGGDQAELRRIFPRRFVEGTNLAELFESGIFGGPDIKEDVFQREIANKNIALPALFIGDSKYDYAAATSAKLDFVFVSDWTEVKDWQQFCAQNIIHAKANLQQLLS